VGRVTPSQVAERMATAILRDRIKTVLNAIDSAVDAVADRTGESGFLLRYAGYTQANFDKAIDGMMDEAETPALFGRHVALAPAVRGFTATPFGDETFKSELTLRGTIGTYHNAQIVTLKDQYAETSADHIIRRIASTAPLAVRAQSWRPRILASSITSKSIRVPQPSWLVAVSSTASRCGTSTATASSAVLS
jgi:hypothetical protein